MVSDAEKCSVIPDKTPTDAGVAGAGVLLSFIITNCISLSLSAIIILMGLRKSTSAPIARKLLLSFSDQQIITGIGIQSVGLAKMKSMVAYHFFIIWLLSLLSTATNLSTLLALVNDFKRDWVLRWLRQVLMLINLVLGVISGIFILQSVMKNLEPRLPIGCVWTVESRGASSNAAVSVAGTIAVIVGNGITFIAATWYLHNREFPKWIKSVQVVGLVFLVASGIGATVRVVMVSQAFGSPPDSVQLVGSSEKEWSFGQLLSLLMLILPVISTVEIMRGETRTPPSRVDDNLEGPRRDDEVMLQGKGGGGGFQSSPFASERDLLRR
ncbi:hypothetical protein K505DRAFT_288672 [Melanomma pulvis-pyrius CBS 109.77]|uniref:Uncharacterized protein n=1 Tax=Melanomma pulvis-pyrius CBS 109.77 TaxID=1314802 RepID=A0A6A6WST0_9PLEO|nr:hypothetical protein K505DRAFT_288672 [Melanomma pulvis-pyrius CBS 109.77]